MKKYLLSILAALPIVFAFSACSDDDNDLPDVDFDFTFENAVVSDGTVYVVQGEDFEITSITVTNNEAGTGCGISSATYYWDYDFIGTSIQPPFGFKFIVSDETPVGEHSLEISCPVFAVDKSLATALIGFDVQVVASPEELPDDGTSGAHVDPKISATNDK